MTMVGTTRTEARPPHGADTGILGLRLGTSCTQSARMEAANVRYGFGEMFISEDVMSWSLGWMSRMPAARFLRTVVPAPDSVTSPRSPCLSAVVSSGLGLYAQDRAFGSCKTEFCCMCQWKEFIGCSELKAVKLERAVVCRGKSSWFSSHLSRFIRIARLWHISCHAHSIICLS